MLTIILVAMGVSMDNLAVSLASGCNPDIKDRHILRAALIFVIAHLIMLSAGWFGGIYLIDYIESYDHWLAFGLLLFLGLKMFKEAYFAPQDKPCINIAQSIKTLILISIATSIDAFAVGLSLSMLTPHYTAAAAAVSLFVFVTTFAGFKLGKKLGGKFGKKAEFAGAAVLVLIAFKILLDGIK